MMVETFDECLVNAYGVLPEKVGTTYRARDDCEYVGVSKHNGLSVVLLIGVADVRRPARHFAALDSMSRSVSVVPSPLVVTPLHLQPPVCDFPLVQLQ